jgi:transposase
VRVKALAVLNVTRGRSRQEVAEIVCAHRQSVGIWVRSYRAAGATGFAVAQGRAKPAQVDGEELENFRVFREHVLAQLQSFVHGSQSLLRYVGLLSQ